MTQDAIAAILEHIIRCLEAPLLALASPAKLELTAAIAPLSVRPHAQLGFGNMGQINVSVAMPDLLRQEIPLARPALLEGTILKRGARRASLAVQELIAL
jgi:hypothetical protein